MCSLEYAQAVVGLCDAKRLPVTPQTNAIFERVKRTEFQPFSHDVFGSDIRDALRITRRQHRIFKKKINAKGK
jgi:hypothetical protein